MRLIRTYGIVLFLMAFAGASTAQGFKAIAKLDSSTMLIGDQLNLTLSFRSPAKTEVLWPSIRDTILGNILVINRSKIDTSYSEDKKSFILSQKIRLTCFDSGFYTIPPIRFYYRNLPDTTTRFEQTEIQILTVHTVAVDTTLAIKPIKAPFRVSISLMEYLPWILGGLLFLAITGFLIYYLMKRKKGEPVFVLKPRIKYLPHEQALIDIESLRAKKLWQAGRVKEYHTELTEILRKYFEDKFHVPAMESTSAEILQNLEDITGISSGTRNKLAGILTLADLVKFAKYIPLAFDNEEVIGKAVEVINETYLIQDLPEPVPASIEGQNPSDGGGTELKAKSEPVTPKIS